MDKFRSVDLVRPTLFVVLFIACGGLFLTGADAWGGGGANNKDRVLLEKVTALTLEEGKMTTGRRSSPVQQLKCVGGTAGCYKYRPRVVQCINRGFNGYDVQWECKTDMDSKYRFGRIQVSCEGYDNPDDPFILRGSCGLEYELDLTEEGRNKQRAGDYQGARGGGYHHDQHHGGYAYQSSSSGFGIGTLIQLAVIGGIIYCCLGCCCKGRGRHSSGSSAYSDYSGSHHHHHHSDSGPGFWSGAATGAGLGYLMGNRGNRYGGGWGSGGWGGGGGWGSGGGGGWSSGGGGGSSSSSSSSRTTSGFGGTSRR